MANFANPTVGSNYTDFPGEIRASVDAALQQLSVGSHTNIPTGAIKFDTSANRWKKFNGSAFEDLTSTYDLNANVSVNQLNLGDDEKIRLGNSQDFEIFHQSSNSNSIIKETGGGIFSLQTNGSQISFFDIPNSSIMAEFNTGGSCLFRHAGNTRLQTTSNGATVTGSLTATSAMFAQGGALSLTNTGGVNQIEVGAGQTGNNFAFIDFVGDATYSDFGLRLIRGQSGNQGPNTLSQLIHRGTGDLQLITQEAAKITFKTSNTTKATITSTGRLGLSTTNPQVLLDAGGASSGGLGGLNNSVLYAGLTNNTNFGGIVLGAGSNGNVPFVAASKLSDGSNLPLDLITAGTSRIRILADGKIGIGTTSPSSFLHVDGDVTISDASPSIRFSDDAGSPQNPDYRIQVNAGKFVINDDTSSVTRLLIDSSGRVGIGTTTPTQLIDVLKSSNDSIIKARTTAAGAYFEADSAASNGFYGIRLSSSGTERWFIGSYNSNNFQIKDGSSASGAERFTIQDGTGNIGIGTTSPAVKLDVVHTNVSVSPGTNDIAVFRKTGEGYLKVLSNNSGVGGIAFGDTDDNFIGAVRYDHSENALEFFVNNSEKVRVDSSGRLGIGTTSPTAPLHIQKSGTSQNLLTLESDMGTVNNRTLIIGSPTSDSMSEPFRFTTGNSIQFRIDASDALTITDSANVGIGTPSPTTKLQIDTPSLNTSSLNTTNCVQLGLRVFAGGAANTTGDIQSGISLGEGRAGLYAYDDGSGAANGLGFWTGSNSGVSEKVNIKSDGKVGISTNSPQVTLDVGGSSSGGLAGLTNPVLYAGFTNNTSFGGVVLGAGANGNTPFIAASKKSNGTGLPLTFNSFGAEVFRISQNALQVGQTTSTNPGQSNTVVGAAIEKNGRISSSTSDTTTGLNLNANTTSNSKHYISMRNSGTQIGSVTQNGASNVSYNDFSDRRVKENIAPLVDALTTLLKLKPVNYNYKADKEKKKFDGFIAQDLLEDKVCDYAATYIEREDWYGIDYSKLVTVAIAAIQELAGKVSALEAKLG